MSTHNGAGGPIRVLIVDDSAVVRGLVARAFTDDPAIEVAGTAMHGEAALSWLQRNSADVAILDVEMPVMDGLETLQRIQSDFPKVRVVMASSLTYRGAETTVRALSMGAAGCIAKPQARSIHDSVRQLVRELVPLVRELGTNQRTAVSDAPVRSQRSHPERGHVSPEIVVIGASTGGPQALTQVLSELPSSFPLPILIVQHMPALFTPMLAKHLARDTRRPCEEAADGGAIRQGHTWIAPGDFHMFINKSKSGMVTRLNQEPPEEYCRPSVNPLFRSAADWYGASVLAVVLTGMGHDGLEGTRAIIANGGHVIVQDEPSSTVWGMPGAIVQAKLAHEVLPLSEIASAVQRLCLQEVARS